jgi:hypothetical protein
MFLLKLNQSNRRGTDPYAWWCGRGDTARCPPIPINPVYIVHRGLKEFGDPRDDS